MEEKDLVICRCEEVKSNQILDAIRAGYTSLSEIKRRTTAGMGLCQGRTCSKIIASMIANELKINLGDIQQCSVRPPIKPVEIGLFEGKYTGPDDEMDQEV
jgi:NAD(P)H-nitrite reductase large subunit